MASSVVDASLTPLEVPPCRAHVCPVPPARSLCDGPPFRFRLQSPPPLFNEVSGTVIQAEKISRLRTQVQQQHEEDYKEAMVTIKNDLKLIEGPDIKENLQDQIRHWFLECR